LRSSPCDARGWLQALQSALNNTVEVAIVEGRKWLQLKGTQLLGNEFNWSIVERSLFSNQSFWDGVSVVLANIASWLDDDEVPSSSLPINVAMAGGLRLREREITFMPNMSKASKAGHPTPSSMPGEVNSWQTIVLEVTRVLGQPATFMHAHMSTLNTALGSVWWHFSHNVHVASMLVWHTIVLLLSSAASVLNFAVMMTVFAVSLVYLLLCSEKEYQPVIWLSALLRPLNTERVELDISNVLHNVCYDVFVSTLKMGCFHGIFTWLTFSMLGCKIVYIWAFLSFMLAMFPLLSTWWLGIPGAIELWLAQDSPVAAVVLLALHFAAFAIVDSAIYSEVRGCPAYLTGLAIFGGLYVWGLEGAFLAPMALCLTLSTSAVFFNTERGQQETERTLTATGSSSPGASLLVRYGSLTDLGNRKNASP
jgi:predicted PurR-regulated permease PerM